MKRISGMLMALAFVAGCSSDNGPGPTTGDLITLTAAQAAALVDKVESFGSTDPSLVALADTVDVILKAGAQARRIDVTTDIGSGPFWAVSLHMPSTMSTPASSTFHIVAFNEPNNPTQFIILGGWQQGTGSSAPNTVTGSLSGPTGTTSVTAHLFSVSGSAVSAWHATAGSSYMTSGTTAGTCVGFTGPGTCTPASMDIDFTISGSIAGSGTAATGQRTASGTVNGIPGIRLSM